jgi:hypothetical protein
MSPQLIELTAGRWRASILLVVATLLALVGVVAASPVLATWTAPGDGTGSATVGALDPPTGVSLTSSLSTVQVTWGAATPPAGSLTGYYVTRYLGSTPLPACGTDPNTPATFVTGTSCNDTSVADGTYTYTVTAVFRSWTSTSAPSNVVTVVGDSSQPSQAVSMSPGATNAVLSGATIFFRSAVAGSFAMTSTVTDGQSGPASATFPLVSQTGWSHAAETVSSGVPSGPGTAYTSSAYTWTPGALVPGTHSIVGRDVANNTVTTPLAFAADDTAPTGGALSVNGVAATAGGSTSYARTTFAIGSRVDYATDTGAGLASSTLTRESATLTNNVCGTFGGSTVITGAPSQTGLTTGCYRYTLTGTDRVGNAATVSTVVRYDTGAATQTVSMSSATNAAMTGTVIYYRSNVTGSFVLNAAVTDGASGPASATFPVLSTAGWTHPAQTVTTGTGSVPTVTYPSTSFSWTANPTRPGTYTVTGRDVAGNTGTTGLTWTADTTAPTGGALTVNAVAGTAAGSTSFNRTGSFTIGTRTDYTDASSGIATSVLTAASATLSNNVCGAFGSTTVITGNPAQSGLTNGCYRYVLTGTDRVGNTASRTTTVKVDLALPTGGAVTVNGTGATGAGTTSSTNSPTFPINLRTDWIDAESGIKTSTLTRQSATYSAGTCGTFGASTTLTGTPNQTGLTTACYRYTLTGTDNANNVTSLLTTVRYDVTVPTGGALTVNGVAASAAGTSSTTTASSFTIGTRTDYTDTASGLSSSTLTRAFAALTGTTCGSPGSPTTLTGAPAQSGLATGCYTYVLTGVDNAGNTTSVSTVVQVRPRVTALALTNGTGTAGRIDAGDQVVITFTDPIAVASACSTWSGDGSDQSLTADSDVTVTVTNGGAGNDTVSVSAASCTLNVGSLNLGSTAYTTANVTFGGVGAAKSTVAWNVGARQLTITLGSPSGAGVATVATSTPVFTPAAGLTTSSTTPVTAPFTGANARQF